MHRDQAGLSLPREKLVRGYPIRRLALGAYLKAAQSLKELPDTVLSALFPDDDTNSAMQKLKHLTPDSAAAVLARGLSALPEPLIGAASELTGVGREALLTDPDIGADGLMEMLLAVIEVNRLENFTTAVRAVRARLKGHPAIGFNG